MTTEPLPHHHHRQQQQQQHQERRALPSDPLPLRIALEESINSKDLDVYDVYHMSLASKGFAALAQDVVRDMVVYDSTRGRRTRHNPSWSPFAPIGRRCPLLRELRCTKGQLVWCLTRNFSSSSGEDEEEEEEEEATFPPGLKTFYVDARDNCARLSRDDAYARAFFISKNNSHGNGLRMVLPDGLEEFYWKNDPLSQILPAELPPGLRVLDCLPDDVERQRPSGFQVPSRLPEGLRVLRVRPIADVDAMEVTSTVTETLDMARLYLPHLDVCDVVY